ncbi:helix-turn-helix transcriptional regulator, partial [Actinophytocola sediminis]
MGVRVLTPLAAAREVAGYTQESLAVALKVERTTIGRWERGVQSPQPWQRRGLANVLQISLEELDDLLRRTVRHPDTAVGPSVSAARALANVELVPSASISANAREHPPAAEVDVIHAAIPRLRRALDRLDLPDDGPTRTPANLQGDIIRASDDRLQSRYGRLARRLPDLIAELARAGQFGDT